MTREIICQGKYKRFIVEDGWEYVERINCTGVVMVLPLTADQKVILVEQFRIPVGSRTLEFPAGLVNDLSGHARESLESAASRELLEETGYQAEGMRFLLTTSGAPGSVADRVAVFRAEGLKKTGRGGGDHTESIKVHEVPLDEIDRWLEARTREGLLVDAKVFTGLYFLKNHVNNG